MMTYHPTGQTIGALLFLAILAIGGLFFFLALRLRYRQLIVAKRSDVRWDRVGERMKNVLVYVLGQKRLPRNGYLYSGVLHIFIFSAFVVLSVDTVNFIIDGLLRVIDWLAGNDMPAAPFHLPLTGGIYQALADTTRFLCMVGLGMAVVNRTIIKPKRLPLTRDAMYTILFIFGLMFFEVLQQSCHLAINAGGGELPANFMWFSSIFGGAVNGSDTGALELGYQISWFAHLLVLLGFSNYVPYSKHSHVFAAPPNIFFMSLEPKGALSKMEFDEDAEYFGARNAEDLSWKAMFDGLSCTECGRCTDNCPATISGKPLRPMYIITDIKHHIEDRYAATGTTVDLAEDESVLLPGGVIDPDVLWSCTTCRACMEVCPVGNEHIPSIIEMRRYLTMSLGEVGHGSQGALKKMKGAGKNPWGMPKKDRLTWAAGMDVPQWNKKEPAEYLYWVGCAGAYDDRAKKVTQSMARLLARAGIDYAVLGNKERCTGDSARRLGDEYLFQEMAEDNIKTFEKMGVKKIITHCPHCFNTLKNEYPQFDGNYEVHHHTEFLAELVREGKLKPEAASGTTRTVAYHDSCYLGRYNEIYDPQRDLLEAMPDVKRVEPPRTRQRGLCCGAGGGQMWMEMNIGERINYVRTDELIETKADVIGVACNFCMTMIDDGVKARSQEENVEVLDLAELLDQRTAG